MAISRNLPFTEWTGQCTFTRERTHASIELICQITHPKRNYTKSSKQPLRYPQLDLIWSSNKYQVGIRFFTPPLPLVRAVHYIIDYLLYCRINIIGYYELSDSHPIQLTVDCDSRCYVVHPNAPDMVACHTSHHITLDPNTDNSPLQQSSWDLPWVVEAFPTWQTFPRNNLLYSIDYCHSIYWLDTLLNHSPI